MLKAYIQKRLKEKSILLMTHIVLGYPSLDASWKIIKTMVESGVDLMELQIPFSEPIADGPVILKANHDSLAKGITVEDCLNFINDVTASFSIPFLIMSYYNILFKYGTALFISTIKEKGIKGAIVPDIPHEEGDEYLSSMQNNNLSPILLFSPTTPTERMKQIAQHGSGFIYCIARKGVTGQDTYFSQGLDTYISKCRNATDLPLALGFGVKQKEDINFLKGKADIAVIGTQSLKIMDEKGIDAVGEFIMDLR